MLQKIKNNDYFGHPVQLNYQKQGATHNTLFGGCVSIVIKFVMIVMVSFKTKQMLFKEEDKVDQSVKSIIDFYDQEVNMNEMKVYPFYAIQANKRGPLQSPVPIDWEESKKYIKPRMYLRTTDYKTF